jgi:hypothetical protein
MCAACLHLRSRCIFYIVDIADGHVCCCAAALQVSSLVHACRQRGRSWRSWVATPSGLLLAAAAVWTACRWSRVV